MKKQIVFLTLFLAASNLFGAYEVKIAMYKNHHFLMAMIAKVKEPEYKKNIVIQKKDQSYYVTSPVYETKGEARKALRAYKKVFKDAFIQDAIKQKPPTQASNNAVIIEKQEPQIEKRCSAEELLANKTVYLCYENASTSAQKRIVQMDFEEEYMEYLPLKSTYAPLKISYTFKDDTVVLPISGLEFVHKIYKKEDNFLQVKSFTDGKESSHTLRYYFKKEDLDRFINANVGEV